LNESTGIRATGWVGSGLVHGASASTSTAGLSTSRTPGGGRITQGGGAWPGYRRVWLVDDPV